MAVNVKSECWILALFIRDDGERLVLGDGAYEFKDKQQHFTANAMVNDTIDVQGNDGTMIAGQVRRASSQSFDGYVGDGSMTKQQIESYRRKFIQFFTKNHMFKVVYVLPDGSAMKRQRGFIVDAPEVKELWQIHPDYHVALNFEDVNYYAYSEDEDGNELFGQRVTINTSDVNSGGLVWDENGAVAVATDALTDTTTGTEITITNAAARTPVDLKLYGQTSQSGTPTPTSPAAVQTVTGEQTVSISSGLESKSVVVNLGKNLFNGEYKIFGYSNGLPTSATTGIEINSATANAVNFTQTEASYVFVISNVIQLHPNTEYTLSFNRTDTPEGAISRQWVYTYNAGTYTNVTNSPTIGVGKITFSFNTGETGQIAVAWGKNNSSSNVGSIVNITNIQLEKGSAATEYAPYFAPIELCKIGEAQDYLYKSNGSWYLHKVTGKKVFSTSDTWVENTCKDGKRFRNDSFTGIATAPNISTVVPMFCSILNAGTAGNTWDAVQCISSDTTANRVWVYISDTKNYTVANFTTYMAGVSVYYPLATPTDTEITNEEVVAGLNSLLATQLYPNNNTIAAESVNLPAEMNLIYYTSGEEPGGFEWEEGGGASIVTAEVSSIENVYPTIIITGPTGNPEIDNLTTGQQIKYTGAITSTQTLIIDTLAQTAKLNGANVVSNLSGSWMSLAPGINRLTFTTDNADAPNATMEWSEVVG